MTWNGIYQITPTKFQCGWCESLVGTDKGLGSTEGHFLYICPHCQLPTTFVRDIGGIGPTTQSPITTAGYRVENLPRQVEEVYDEARRCLGASCPTASVLLCRKLLMNVAVNHGAPAGQSFVTYVTYLNDSGFIPPNGRGWVDALRTKGNEATHEIALASLHDARELLEFAGMLLKFVYEFPSKAPVIAP